MTIECPDCGSDDIDLAEESDLTWECQECGETFDADDEPEARNGLPRCQLSGEDGNVFFIIARVGRALKDAARDDPALATRAAEWYAAAAACSQYWDVIALASDYVDVR